MLIAAIDAYYRKDGSAIIACVGFHDWTASKPCEEHALVLSGAADYEPGAFYKRELPGILALIRKFSEMPSVIVVDGYVWLAEDRPGLGARLWEALGRTAAVIGVAKSHFRGAPAVEVCRGRSRRPLFVTSAGLAVEEEAARLIASMHGAHRIPTLLRRVDGLARK